jgi:hypothetical protein
LGWDARHADVGCQHVGIWPDGLKDHTYTACQLWQVPDHHPRHPRNQRLEMILPTTVL